MQLQDAVVFITGANRGIGLACAREALARGARRVYAASRQATQVSLAGVTPIELDVTQPEQVARAARGCGDVSLLINNAGVAEFGPWLGPEALDSFKRLLDVNVFGLYRMAHAFAPVLAAQGGGAILNVLSVASWINSPLLGAYGASKSAAWALSNGLRQELRPQGTQVTALHMSFVDTEMAQGIQAPKSSPEAIVRAAFDGLQAGLAEVLADDRSRQVKRSLSSDAAAYLPQA